MMNQAAPLDRLLAALREHEIPLGRDDIEWAFKSQKTNKEVVEWVKQYIGPETVLSKEEAELYSKLEKKGILEELTRSQDVATTHPIGDSDLRAAIAALQASTAAIEKHTETLKKQRHALNDLADHDQTETKARKRTTDQRVKKHLSEKQHLDLVVDELSQSIRSQLASSQRQLKSSNVALLPAISELLRKDDRILSELEKAAGGEDVPKDQGKMAAGVESLCSTLAALKSRAIQCRLDYIYIEAQNNTSPTTRQRSTDDEAELLSLQEELDSLYSEIAPVAEMAVQQEYKEPIMHTLDKKHHEAVTHADRRLEYVSSTLAYLVTRLDSVTARIQDHHSHTSAFQEVSKAALLELGSPAPERAYSANRSASPIRRPGVVSEGRSPLHSSIQRSNSASSVDIEPHWQLFKSLGIHASQDAEPDELDKILSAEAAERNERLSRSVESLESSIISALAVHIGDADMALQLLHHTLHADTPYHEVHLSPEDSNAEMKLLEQRISDLGKGMAGLNMEVLHRQDTKKEHFVERWSR